MNGPQEVSTYRQVDWRRYATAKLSTEYDSEGSVFVNKLSSRIFNGPEKITGSFQREASGDLRYPLLGVVTKYLSVIYDPEDKNALVTVKADVGQNLQVKYLQDVKVGSPPSKFVLVVFVIRVSALGCNLRATLHDDHEVVRALKTHLNAVSWRIELEFCVVMGLPSFL